MKEIFKMEHSDGVLFVEIKLNYFVKILEFHYVLNYVRINILKR